MKYKFVAVGGTFDRFHHGHESFLTFAFSIGEKLLIGLTTDSYISKFKKYQGILDFKTRKKNLEVFLKAGGFLNRSKIVPIDDRFGPLLTNEYPIQALALTTDNLEIGLEINKQRKSKGMDQVNIEPMELVTVSDIPISSTIIRKGKMNISGDLILPPSLRSKIKKPMGSILKEFSHVRNFDPNKIVTVGDETTNTFNKKKINQKISVVDFIVNRKKKYESLKDLGFKGNEYVYNAINPSGNITHELSEALNFAIKKAAEPGRIVISVAGEEDLAVIPLVLLLPQSWRIFYGQPDLGIVEIEVNTSVKNKFRSIVSRFESRTLGS